MGLALVLLLTIPAAASGPLRNFKLGGQIDLQATSADDVTDFQTYGSPKAAPTSANRDRIGNAQTRVLLHMDWDLLDDVHSKLTLRKNNRSYGQNGNASESVDNVTANVFIDQAYVKVDKFAGVDMTLGRQFFGVPGDMVLYFGPSDKARYGLPSSAIDGGRFDWSNEAFGFTGLVAKTNGSALGTVPQPDTDVHGFNLLWKGNDNMNASVYLWRQVTHRTASAEGTAPSNGALGALNDYLYVGGLKGKLVYGEATLAVEVAKNYGDNRNAGSLDAPASRAYAGWAGKANASYAAELRGLGAVTPWLHAGYGSGDGSPQDYKNDGFVAISPDYRPGAIYGRFATGAGGANNPSLGSGLPSSAGGIGSNALSNRQIWGLGVKYTPERFNQLTIGVSFWDFSLATSSSTRASGGVRHLGSETDLDLTWQHNENVSASLGVARFDPGGYVNEAIQSQNLALGASARSQRGVTHPWLAYFDVRIKF